MKKFLSTKKFLTTAMALTLSTALFVGVADAKPHDNGSAGGNGKSAVHSVSPSKSEVKSESKQAQANTVNKGDKQTTKTVKADVKEQKKSKVQANKEKVELVKERVKAKIEAKAQAKTEIQALKDVENHWAKDSILRMQLLGVVGGYEDGTFRPQSEVTEAEAISLIIRLFGEEDQITDEEKIIIEDNTDETIDEDENEEETSADEDTEDETEVEENEDEFADVPEWAKGSAIKAKEIGILNPNRFHSHVQASRAKTTVWVAKAMGLEPVDTTDITFSDKILISPEDVGYIMALVNEGYLKGTSEGKFNPNSAITRAELVVIVDRILQEQEQSDQDETIEDEETTDDIIIEDTTDDDTEDESAN